MNFTALQDKTKKKVILWFYLYKPYKYRVSQFDQNVDFWVRKPMKYTKIKPYVKFLQCFGDMQTTIAILFDLKLVIKNVARCFN